MDLPSCFFYGSVLTKRPKARPCCTLARWNQSKCSLHCAESRLRSLGIQINKARHTLKFSAATILTPLGGAALRSRLELCLTRGYLAYLEDKTAWIQQLELDSQRLFANIRVEGEANVRAMAESFLGYETPFQLRSKTYQAPMGIPGEDVEPTVEHPTTIRPQESELPTGTLTLRASSYGAKYDFRVKVYATPQGLPDAVRGMRFRPEWCIQRFNPDLVELACVLVDRMMPFSQALSRKNLSGHL